MVDEAVPDKFIYDNKKPCSKARIYLVVEWLLLGYLITMSYKSVLRASLVSIQYEKPIETLEDMLVTDRKILGMADTATEIMLRTDPRPGMQELANKITWLPLSKEGLAMARPR